MDHVTLILVISPVLFLLVYWCWSSLMSAEGRGTAGANGDAAEASGETETMRGAGAAFAEIETKPLAR